MTFTVGGVDVTAVHVGATAAEAVYLGDVKVWPTAPAQPSYVDTVLGLGPVAFIVDEQPETDMPSNGTFLDRVGFTWECYQSALNFSWAPDTPRVGLKAQHGDGVGGGHFTTTNLSLGSEWTMLAFMPTQLVGTFFGVFGGNTALDHSKGAGIVDNVWLRAWQVHEPSIPAGDWMLIAQTQTAKTAFIYMASAAGLITSEYPAAANQWPGTGKWNPFSRSPTHYTHDMRLSGMALFDRALNGGDITTLWGAA